MADETVTSNTGIGGNRTDNSLRPVTEILLNVGLFVVFSTYVLIGAGIFVALEAPNESSLMEDSVPARERFLAKLGKLANETNATRNDYDEALTAYENNLETESIEEQWTYGMAAFYCFKLLSTLGQGDATLTAYGKLFSTIYAFIGIVILFSFLLKIGSRLATVVDSGYIRVRKTFSNRYNLKYRRRSLNNDVTFNSDTGEPRPQEVTIDNVQMSWMTETNDELNHDDVTQIGLSLPLRISLLVTLLFVLVFTGFISILEGWNFVDSYHFSFMALATVGFGNLPPEKNHFGSVVLIFGGFIITSTLIALISARISTFVSRLERRLDRFISRKLK